MKKFLLKIIVFGLPIIVTSYFIDYIISNNLKKSNTYAEGEFSTWNAIMEGKLDSEILVYGSSRAWVHFDPQIIQDTFQQNTFNIGIDGHSFEMQYLRHSLALKNNSKPKTIIHSVDFSTLEKSNSYNADQFLPYMLWDSTFYHHLSPFEGFSYFDYHFPLVRYYGNFNVIKEAVKMEINKSNEVKRVKGYQGNIQTWDTNFDKIKDSLKGYTIEIDTHVVNLFDHYLQECKEDSIDVILVYSPCYIKGQKLITNQQEVINLLEKFADKYDLLFMNYTNDALCYDRKYFYNCWHLNKTGATLFTKKFAHELKQKKPRQ